MNGSTRCIDGIDKCLPFTVYHRGYHGFIDQMGQCFVCFLLQIRSRSDCFDVLRIDMQQQIAVGTGVDGQHSVRTWITDGGTETEVDQGVGLFCVVNHGIVCDMDMSRENGMDTRFHQQIAHTVRLLDDETASDVCVFIIEMRHDGVVHHHHHLFTCLSGFGSLFGDPCQRLVFYLTVAVHIGTCVVVVFVVVYTQYDKSWQRFIGVTQRVGVSCRCVAITIILIQCGKFVSCDILGFGCLVAVIIQRIRITDIMVTRYNEHLDTFFHYFIQCTDDQLVT